MIKLKSYYAKTDQGPYLELNEDDHLISISERLFAIFDGFGGSGAGDKATQQTKKNIHEFYSGINGDEDSTFPFSYSHQYLVEGNALVNAIEYAHKEIVDDNSTREMNNRGGCSVAACALAENIMTFVHVGNCAAYLIRSGNFRRIVEPDIIGTVCPDMFYGQFHQSPVNGVGLFSDLYPKIKEFRVVEDDQIVLLTDGAYSRMNDSELKHFFTQFDYSNEEKVEKLFSMSNNRGNRDNQTAVILQF